MQIIKDQQIIDNEWRHSEEIGELPSGKVSVSIEHWQAQREALIARGHIGLRLTATDSLDTIKNDLKHFELIAIEFDKFNDGRGFTLARLLHERHGYAGEIRAVGTFLRDQLYYMERCGFNAFELPEGQDLQEALNAFSEFSVTAQPDVHHTEAQAGPWR